MADRERRIVSKTVNEIPDATYLEQDLDGDPDDRIVIPQPLSGGYTIKVIPEPGADPTERVTLSVEDAGRVTTLLDQVQIQEVPAEQITAEVDRTAPVLSLSSDPAVLNPDGDDLSFTWDFGDGRTGTGPQPTHVYADNGVYTVTLTVSDGHFDRAVSDTLLITCNNVKECPDTGDLPGQSQQRRRYSASFYPQ